MEATPNSGGGDDDCNQIAIRRLVESPIDPTEIPGGAEDNPAVDCDDDDGHHHQLLVELLSQVESVKAQESSIRPEETSREDNAAGAMGTGAEEVLKELKKVQRQNTITHRLLSTLIVLTLAWQLSEVSLLLKLKDGLSHPFRSLGSMITWMIAPGVKVKDDDPMKQNPSYVPPPPLQIPHVGLGGLNVSGEKGRI
ncbi:hypothetical protein Dimus_015274 [Dionaea muscipula]